MTSFLRCCTDVDLVTRWICVDDGSDGADRRRMEERYPFFEFIWKDRSEKGHARSMNMLLDQVATPYWLHLEDDWQFFATGRYIDRARAVLDDDASIGQVLFNRNYGETLEDRGCPGGDVRRTARDGTRYRLHQHHAEGTPAYDAVFADLPPGATTHVWWPHFSLRPSLMRTDPIREIGRFDTDHDHFELDFAHRYAAAGHRSAFFDSIHCLHTGPLTKDRGPERLPNAYELNGEPQFGRRARSDAGAPPFFDGLEVHVVNLDRRTDRWERFIERSLTTLGPELVARVHRFSAVDGRAVQWSAELEHLFGDNDFGARRGFVGCALSHFALWRQLARSDAPGYLVFEDDAEPCAGLVARLLDTGPGARGLLSHDMIFLGYFRWSGDAGAVAPAATRVRLQPMDWPDYVGGTFGYVISRRGAERLVALASRDGIRHGIDRFVHVHSDELDVMRLVPDLVRAPLATPGSEVDSDIQHDATPVAGSPSPRASTVR